MFVRLLILFCFILQCDYSVAKEMKMLNVRTIAVSPYGIIEHEHYSGIYYDLSNMLFENANITFENIIFPYARVKHELMSGQADVTIMLKYQELEPYVDYIAPLPALRNVVIGKKSLSISSLDDLNGKVIAYLRGAQFSEKLDEAHNISKQFVNDFEQGIEMMRLNRVDAIIGPLPAILSSAKRIGLAPEFFGQPYAISTKIPWLQVSKKSITKVDLSQMKVKFKKLIHEGSFARLNEKYLH
jgi:polar amino acid transport system substrate-binding protein